MTQDQLGLGDVELNKIKKAYYFRISQSFWDARGALSVKCLS